MPRINYRRVVAGGLAAGLVYNVGETVLNVGLAEPLEEIAHAHAMREPTLLDIGLFVLLGFVLGLLLTWLYAAVRPRLGPGPRTAAAIALAVWIPASLTPTVGWVVFGFTPLWLAGVGLAWGLVELLLASLVGGWIYRES